MGRPKLLKTATSKPTMRSPEPLKINETERPIEDSDKALIKNW